MSKLATIVLAAGKSTRIKSSKSKLLHEIAGEKVITTLSKTLKKLQPDQVVYVVSHQKNKIITEVSHVFNDFDRVDQGEPKGTAHAVKKGLEKLVKFRGDILILAGDVPFLSLSILEKLITRHHLNNSIFSLLSFEPENPHGYGRIIRKNNKAVGIIEQKELKEEDNKIKECNGGIYLIQAQWLRTAIDKIENKNKKQEFYLTDLIYEVPSDSEITIIKTPSEELLGLNTRTHFAQGEKIRKQQLTKKFMDAGVGFINPDEVYLETEVEIGKDTIIEKDVALRGNTVIGKNCRISQGSIISDSIIEDGALIKPYSVIEDSVIGNKAQIGPFSHLRPETVVGNKAKIGNFVETKKTRLGEGVKASHLSYLGDAVIGENSNIGAGTITCNYDGTNKFVTTLGKEVFVGSDSQLIAPVTVGDNAYIGSGTTVMKDVPANTLVVNPKQQKNIAEWNQDD
ncbi:MAG: bifunctional UDP-N-acetylglucosamine diphosphorylase/glucosamine-1-phosphate N-acetyltransferase GlmU [Myxococcota bacterium]